MNHVYLDNAATTPIDPRVVSDMHAASVEYYGNPSSLHRTGRMARDVIEKARVQLANLIGGNPDEIYFTSSGTEAANLALAGVAETCIGTNKQGGCHFIASSFEHPAVFETCQALKRRGVEVSFLPVNATGLVDPSDLSRAIRPDTRLVSVMAANNVVGTLQPIAELGRITRDRGVLFHTDAVQAVGKIPFHLKTQPIDLLSLSGHKFNGPKGVGALFVRKGVKLTPLLHGGGQEQGLRPSTENITGILGLGRAAEIAKQEMTSEVSRLVDLRDRIIDSVTASIPNAYLIGDRYLRLPGHLCFGFQGQEGEAIRVLLALDEHGIAVSSGSACSSHHTGGPSSVLMAMGMNPIQARGSLRISLGRFNTDTDVDYFLNILPKVVSQLRRISTNLSSSTKGHL
ncbi:cysteine desulfurase family protein [Bdellovibrionota bacterium FG-1]